MNQRRARAAGRLAAVEALEPRALLTVGAGSGAATVASPPAQVTATATGLQDFFVKFVGTATPAQEQATIRDAGGSVVTSYPDGLTLVAAGAHTSEGAAIGELRTSPLVAYTQANSLIHDAATTVIPNDPGFPYSWGLNNANNVDIDAP